MKKQKFELFITFNNKQHVFEVENEEVLIGSAPHCHVKIQDSTPPVKVSFYVEDGSLVVKIYDLKFPIRINGKKYKTAKLSDSIFFKVGSIDVILSVEEVFIEDDQAGLEDGFEEEFDQTRFTSVKMPSVPEIPRPEIQKPEEHKNVQPVTVEQPAASTSVPLEAEIEDIIFFSTIFDSHSFQPLSLEAYSKPELDFTDYIDPEDETIERLPSPDLIKPKSGFSIHVIQMENGTVLAEKFFDSKYKRLYVSENYGKRNYFQAPASGVDKIELAFVKGDEVSVVALEGFGMTKTSHDQVFQINSKTVQLLPSEKVIYTKGTTQLVVQLAEAVPLVKDANYFDFDEEMLKSVAYAWVFALFMLINFLVVDIPKEEEKKKVVIYKVKKQEKPKKEIVQQEDMPKPAATQKTVEKKQEPAPKPKQPVKKVVKKKPVVAKKAPRVIPKKVTPKPEAKKVSQKVAKQKPPKKKEYKFNFASKMASSLNSAAPTTLRAAKKASAVNVNAAMNSSTNVAFGKINDSKMGTSDTKVSRFAASRARGASRMTGTKGLSGKVNVNTAYMEAKTKVLGSLDPNLIRKIMREHIPAFRYCYQQELLENSKVAGVFDVNFQINAAGKGVRTSVKSKGQGFSRNGLTCIKRVVSRIKFPKPKGGGYVDVRQPMNFYTN